jgi:predicted DNA-binding protein (MmcQ/YjbR family)
MVTMDIEAIRSYCLEFPHTTENVQWGCDLCLKVDGKLFAVMPLEPAPVRLSFKCSPERFADLCERPGIRPAPYMARAQWVALEQLNTLPDSELRELLAESYRLVFERLPKKRQQQLSSGKPEKRVVGRRPASVGTEAQPARKAKRAGAAK